ncbi:MAG: LysR family transcriptional regulator [Caulobacteraceae bacterium]|nr:LysR family transcriptional regulator [Caulobacteraceae bacterium]
MARNLDITALRAFVTVADRGGMTTAANALHLTQGAVSQQIGRLEDQFGGALFTRDRRGIQLTAFGERLLGRARRLLSLNDEIWTSMTEVAMDGTVRLGAPYDLVGPILAPVLKTYAEARPRVEISLTCASSPDLLTAMARGDVDLVLVEEPLGVSTGECLAVERLVWVGAKGGSAHLRDPLPISMVAETCAFRPAVIAALSERGRNWRTVFENGSIDATTATVRSDLAITPSLICTVAPDLDILCDAGLPELPPFSINLHLPRHQVSAAVVELAHHIREGLARGRRAA